MNKLSTLFFVFVVLFALNAYSQDNKPSIQNEINPRSLFQTPGISLNAPKAPNAPNALYDLLRNYNGDSLYGSAYGYGVVWTGSYFIISSFNANKFYRVRANWTLIDSFVVSGVAATFRDMTFYNGRLWGTIVSGAIYGVDTGTFAVVKTINCSGAAQIRALCWDPVRKGFWCGTNSFTGPFVCYDTNGAAITGATFAGPASGCYGIAYDDDPAGPFLWVSTDQTPASNTGISMLKFNATTLAQIGTPINLEVPLTTGAPLASGGCDLSKKLIPGKRTFINLVQGTPDRVIVVDLGNTDAGPLQPFSLQSPAAGTTITSIPGSSTPVTFMWDTSRAAATYKVIYGTALPTRLITIPASTNMLSMTLGQLDAILAGVGLNQGDSVSGSWDVWAFRNNDPQNDSLKASNGPRTLKLKRAKPALTAFNLLTPPTGAVVTTVNNGTNVVSFSWSKTGAGAKYKLMYASPNFNNTSNIKFTLQSNNSGFDSLLTTTDGNLDALISSFVNPGDSSAGQWRVYAYSGNDSLASAQTYNITFKRLPVLTIGTGSTASQYPFVTFYHDARTQLLYTKSEILAAGGSGKAITAIGFNVIAQYPQPMLSFTIKMQNYADSSLSGFVDAGNWITVYSNPSGYSVPSTGWVTISLTTPFPYDINKNLLIDICFDNTSYTTSSTVASTTGAPFDTRQFNRHMDNGAGCSLTSSSGYNYTTGRPNIQLVLNPLLNVNPVMTGVPQTYTLSQNYPNPFNPATKINFGIPAQGLVTLKIYDMLGREVTSLVNEVRPAGYYSVDFNAANLSSGVYFYKLESNNFVDVKKMILIK